MQTIVTEDDWPVKTKTIHIFIHMSTSLLFGMLMKETLGRANFKVSYSTAFAWMSLACDYVVATQYREFMSMLMAFMDTGSNDKVIPSQM